MRGKWRASREVLAFLPWIAAAIVWLGLVSPMRADEENRLSQQSRIRRERVKAEKSLRQIQASRARVSSALANLCRSSLDPAALRQRAVAATAGLPLSPFSLTVNGGPEGGAIVDASGPRAAVLELLHRLGDPSRGGFLRGVSLREKGGGLSLSATTGVFEATPGGIIAASPNCSGVSDPPAAADPSVRHAGQAQRSVAPRPMVASTVPVQPSPQVPFMAAPPPFTLVAFLIADGKVRVSIRVRDEIRVVSAGESVDGWKCVSIDRDEGALFMSPANERLVLKAGATDGGR